MHSAIMILLLFLPPAIGAIGQSIDSGEFIGDHLEVTLELKQEKGESGDPQIDAWVTVKNAGLRDLNLQSLRNRLAVAFIVFNSAGNIVPPKLVAKADPRSRKFTLKPGMKANERFDGLKFITGTAQQGYDLKKGERYTVVAIYRPTGLKSAGICSREMVMDLQ